MQYMEIVAILRNFSRAERTGQGKIYWQTVFNMLPYLTAAGLINYMKLARLYLQKMNRLEHTIPTLVQSLEKGLHVVRRSNIFWAGLSTDSVIEQELMKNLKTETRLN